MMTQSYVYVYNVTSYFNFYYYYYSFYIYFFTLIILNSSTQVLLLLYKCPKAIIFIYYGGIDLINLLIVFIQLISFINIMNNRLAGPYKCKQVQGIALYNYPLSNHGGLRSLGTQTVRALT